MMQVGFPMEKTQSETLCTHANNGLQSMIFQSVSLDKN